MAIYKNLSLVSNTLQELAESIQECYSDVTIYHKSDSILIFSVPKFNNKLFKFEEVKYGSYNLSLFASVGDSYASGTTINNEVYFLPRLSVSDGNSYKRISLEFYGTDDGFIISHNSVRGVGNGVIIGGVAKDDLGNYIAFGMFPATIKNYKDNVNCVDLTTKEIKFLYPLGHPRLTGLSNKSDKMELQKIALLDSTLEYIRDDNGDIVYFVNLFATIAQNLTDTSMYNGNLGYVTGSLGKQQSVSWMPRSFTMLKTPIMP